jgi:hypothetical protein
LPREPAPAPSPPLEPISTTDPLVNGPGTTDLLPPRDLASEATVTHPGPTFSTGDQTTFAAPPTEHFPQGPVNEQPETVAEPSLAAARLRREQEARKGLGGMVFMLLVFLPVLLWAIGSTAIGVWLYTELQTAQRRNKRMWEGIPDASGDTPGIRPPRPGNKKQGRAFEQKFNMRQALLPLPESQKVVLGKDAAGKERSIQVGDLEVTPLRVRRRRLSIMVTGYEKAEPLPTDSLVLYLRLKNLARDYAFTPVDNYFDRKYQGGETVPLTVLVAGKENFFGGPAAWISQSEAGQKNRRREWVEGRKDIDPVGLGPGEEMETFVCTNGEDARIARYLFGVNQDGDRVGKPYRGPLLWRVHLRRGRLYRDDRPYAAATVIGVEFTDKDYEG